jgi:hypothetical protein
LPLPLSLPLPLPLPLPVPVPVPLPVPLSLFLPLALSFFAMIVSLLLFLPCLVRLVISSATLDAEVFKDFFEFNRTGFKGRVWSYLVVAFVVAFVVVFVFVVVLSCFIVDFVFYLPLPGLL